MRRIDVLMAHAESDLEGQALVAALREGLQKLGWTESRNIGSTLAGRRPTWS
jgi:hypothetical protein